MAYDAAAKDGADAIKVFVSYSRADTPFALDLVAALQACGFEAFIDQEDIAPGEPWEHRLGALIESADTVVYVLTPDSLVSEHCSWEMEETLRLNKRLLPVLWREVPDGEVPKGLSALNYTYFTGKNSFATSLKELSSALRVDHGWIREHTRIGGLARRWDSRGRSDALLLRGDELEAAASWAEARPHGAPELRDDQIDLIAASKAARDAADRAARNRRRGLLIGVSSVALAMTGLAAFSLMQWQAASEAKGVAESASAALAETNEELQGALTRLGADIALRVPPTGDNAFETSGGWFPIAANFSGAVAQINQGRQTATGFLIDGSIAHPDWSGRTFLLAPGFVSDGFADEDDAAFSERMATTRPGAASADESLLSDEERSELADRIAKAPQEFLAQRYVQPAPPLGIPMSTDGPDVDEDQSGNAAAPQTAATPRPQQSPPDGFLTARFPTLDAGKVLSVPGEPVWRTEMALLAEIPFTLFELKADLPFGARAILPRDIECNEAKSYSTESDRYALYGIDGGADADALTLLVTEGLEFFDYGDVTYRHAELRGAFGAPVFHLDTGKLVAIHIGVMFDSDAPAGRVGVGEALLPLIDMMRDDISIDREDEERTEPLCWAVEDTQLD